MFSEGREYIKNNNGLYFIILDNIDTLLSRRGMITQASRINW